MAIVNPAHITPYAEIPEDQRKLANDLIFNERPDALPRFIQYFEQNAVTLDGGDGAEDPTEGMTAEQALHWQIVHRKKEGVEALIDDCLTPAGRGRRAEQRAAARHERSRRQVRRGRIDPALRAAKRRSR